MTNEERKTYNALLLDIYQSTGSVELHVTKKGYAIDEFCRFCEAMIKTKGSV